MIVCPSCGFHNIPQAIFCSGCVQLLQVAVCPSCGASNPGANRFCNQCSASLEDAADVAEITPPTDVHYQAPDNSASHAVRSSKPAAPDFLRHLAILPRRIAGSPITAMLSKRSTPLLISGALAVVLAQLGLTFSVEHNQRAPIGYMLALALGTGLFALGAWRLRTGQAAEGFAYPAPFFTRMRISGIFRSTTAAVGILIGALALAALFIPLGAGAASGYTLLPWIVALAAFASPLFPRMTSAAASSNAWLREHYKDILIVLALMGLFIALIIYDLEDWYYSIIGDEFSFYEHAKRIAEEGITHPFSQEGVFGKHPVMSSFYQAIVMRVFGVDYWGWTFSETLNAALTIPGIYLLGHIFGGRKAAVISAALFCFCHYIFAFSHTGYNNLSPLPVSVWSLALFILGWRKENPLLLYTAGIVAGLGFYTLYAGRAMLPIILLFALASGSPRKLPALLPLAFGFALTVAPTFVVDQEGVFTRMFGQVVGGYSEAVSGDTSDRILSNIEINLIAFNYSSTALSYVYGPLFDPVSAVLATLGIAFALGHIREPSMRLLLIWFGVAIFITGVLSPYVLTAVTRMMFVVPPMVLLAGTMASRVSDIIQARAERRGFSFARHATQVIFALMLALVLILNLWQFHRTTPSIFQHAPEAVALGAFRSSSCGADVGGTVFVGRVVGEGSVLTKMLSAFSPREPLPRMVSHQDIASDMDMELPGPTPGCVVFINPSAPEARALQEDLTRRYAGGRIQTFANPAGNTAVEIFTLLQN